MLRAITALLVSYQSWYNMHRQVQALLLVLLCRNLPVGNGLGPIQNLKVCSCMQGYCAGQPTATAAAAAVAAMS
jgi:hypothetical protein